MVPSRLSTEQAEKTPGWRHKKQRHRYIYTYIHTYRPPPPPTQDERVQPFPGFSVSVTAEKKSRRRPLFFSRLPPTSTSKGWPTAVQHGTRKTRSRLACLRTGGTKNVDEPSCDEHTNWSATHKSASHDHSLTIHIAVTGRWRRVHNLVLSRHTGYPTQEKAKGFERPFSIQESEGCAEEGRTSSAVERSPGIQRPRKYTMRYPQAHTRSLAHLALRVRSPK